MASELAGFSLEAPGNPGNFLASSTQVRQLLTASAVLPVPAQCVKFPSPTTASWQFHTHKMFTQRRKIHFPPLVLFKRKANNRFSKKKKSETIPFIESPACFSLIFFSLCCSFLPSFAFPLSLPPFWVTLVLPPSLPFNFSCSGYFLLSV